VAAIVTTAPGNRRKADTKLLPRPADSRQAPEARAFAPASTKAPMPAQSGCLVGAAGLSDRAGRQAAAFARCRDRDLVACSRVSREFQRSAEPERRVERRGDPSIRLGRAAGAGHVGPYALIKVWARSRSRCSVSATPRQSVILRTWTSTATEPLCHQGHDPPTGRQALATCRDRSLRDWRRSGRA
jgi:hypothetical protein